MSAESPPFDCFILATHDAGKACAALGEGWRLPTIYETNILFQNKDAIGGFANGGFWSSTEGDFDNAWWRGFASGQQGKLAKHFTNYVRAVRDL